MTVLFFIATVLLFLTVDWLVRRSRERRSEIPAPIPRPIRELSVRVPEGIFFAPSHTWLNLFPSGKVRLGVDDFISGLLERPAVRLLRSAGEMIAKGDPLLELTSDGHHLTVRSPIDCQILSVNSPLGDNPELLTEALFTDGWAYTIKPSRNTDLKQLLLGAETTTWIRGEYQRLKDLLAGPTPSGAPQPAYLQEGGPPIAGVLEGMDDAIWLKLDSEFLRV